MNYSFHQCRACHLTICHSRNSHYYFPFKKSFLKYKHLTGLRHFRVSLTNTIQRSNLVSFNVLKYDLTYATFPRTHKIYILLAQFYQCSHTSRSCSTSSLSSLICSIFLRIVNCGSIDSKFL